MTGSERALWHLVRKHLGDTMHLQRLEDKFAVGVPDLSYAEDGVEGWLEFKHRPAYPTRSSSDMKFLSSGQRMWQAQRLATGVVRIWNLIQIDRDYHLVHGSKATILWAGITEKQMWKAAHSSWKGRLVPQELRICLLKNPEIASKTPKFP